MIDAAGLATKLTDPSIEAFAENLFPPIPSELPAGIEGMALPTFLLYSTLGTAVWTAFLTSIGFALGENYSRVEDYVGPVSKVAIALIPLSFIFWLLLRQRRRSLR